MSAKHIIKLSLQYELLLNMSYDNCPGYMIVAQNLQTWKVKTHLSIQNHIYIVNVEKFSLLVRCLILKYEFKEHRNGIFTPGNRKCTLRVFVQNKLFQYGFDSCLNFVGLNTFMRHMFAIRVVFKYYDNWSVYMIVAWNLQDWNVSFHHKLCYQDKIKFML